MQLNTKTKSIRTHEGARAKHINPEQALRRSVMSCMLWEDGFYEDGVAIADRIVELCGKLSAEKVEAVALEAREQMNLRHVPLLMLASLTADGTMSGNALASVIQRPDELCEFLAIYWRNGKCPLSNQVKKGLAAAFQNFSEYQLAKYDRPGAIKLRDVLFLCHAKGKDAEQQDVFDRLADRNQKLKTPDTWETNLSAGADKKETFTRLIKEEKLGALALLRNLRNMNEAGVPVSVIRRGLERMDCRRVLPFRFIAAARYVPGLEPDIEDAFYRCFAGESEYRTRALPGKTILLGDVSYSMHNRLSGKSEMTRLDAACGLAMVCRELCEDVEVWTFSNDMVQVPARRGFALRDAIVGSQPHSGTWLGAAVNLTNQVPYDRLIVITDEQSHDTVPDPAFARSYMINVASNRNGVGYGKWTHLDGWSEKVLDFVMELEGSAVPEGR